ncbi:MAG: ABC transporter permease subunit [Polyangiaceae bacterium]|nr:ABC transporter permease subunit [Polyangiaceae bacterium]
MRTVWNIAKREFTSNFLSPLAYVVICLSLVLLGIFFFMVWGGGFWQADRATMAQMFQWMPRGLAFVVVPVVTMRLLAEEKRSGTLEMLITLPVKDHEVILGKFLGAWGLVLVLIAATALFPIFMFWWPWNLGALDWRTVGSGYLGLVLFSAAAVSIGLLLSALTESQVIAFFLTWATLLVFTFWGLAADTFSNQVMRDVAAYVSFDARLAPFARGMINTRDLVFFVSICFGCLMTSFWALERRKWA